MKIYGDLCHEKLLKKARQRLAFDESKAYGEWKEQIREKFLQLFGMDKFSENTCPLNVQIEKEEQKTGYRQIRFVFESEQGAFVPCYLLIPDLGKEKYPVAITLQGHTTGFHNSIGEMKFERDAKQYPNNAFAVQAAKNGYAALAIEQRAMGERGTDRNSWDYAMCGFTALTALQIGRTVLGERIWDVSKAIDALAFFPQCDREKVLITGNSGGGTAAYYAACYDSRIQLSAPSCSFCSYEKSIMDVYHCVCNYVPHAYEWFEMQDLSCLIAPRKLVIIAGKEDEIFPIQGVRDGFERVQKIYEKEAAAENCRLVETPEGHYWCEELVWNAINRETEKLKWR